MKTAALLAGASGLLLLVPGAVAAPGHAGCPADNCLRALRATQTPGRLDEAQSFCATYTADGAVATIPAYAAAACAENHAGPLSARLSSACSCIGPRATASSPPSTPMPSSSPSATTVTPSTSALITPSTAPSFSASTSMRPSMSTTPSSASSTTSSSSATSPAATEPCAIASSAWAAQTAANPGAEVTILASVARACLDSVPLNQAAALDLVDAIEPYLEWQSDAAYKASPPADYPYPAYDMFAALATVRANVASGAYASEVAFQEDLYLKVFGQGHDGHMVYYPDLLTGAFAFGHGLALVSISDDAATGTPVVKLLSDVEVAPATAPTLVQINGVDTEQAIQEYNDRATYNQDKDAAYNSMFYSAAVAGAGGGNGFWARGGRIRFVYPGPNTTYTFSNGSTTALPNVAYVHGSLAGVTDGASMFTKFCPGAQSAQGQASDNLSPPTNAVPSLLPSGGLSGYPAPVNSTSDGVASCYFLEGAGFEDVAVLALLSFEPKVPAEFQAVVHGCLAAATAAGRTRLVVDTSNNGGGYIFLGYDFFRQLFPQTLQDGFSRWKANPGFVGVASTISNAVAGVSNPATSDDEDLINLYESVFDWRFDLDQANASFTSFANKFGPEIWAGTDYTAIMRWNLADPLITINDTYGMGMWVSGYGALADLEQPDLDVVLLYDGVCASTCTIASEMLRIQGGVPSVALGGRPSVAGKPIQGVGGVKGSQVYQFSDILDWVLTARNRTDTTNPDNAATVAALSRYNDLPIRRSRAAGINVRDQILRDHVDDGLPAQFVHEDADCRLYYTADMVTDITAVWRAAADAAFHGGACAAGSVPATQKKRTAQHKQNLATPAAMTAQAANGFRPLDLAPGDLARFNAEFNQKVIV